MLDTESWERIARYALGECGAEEAIATRAWIDADPERRELADELVRLADAGPTAIWNAAAAWQRFRATVADAPTRTPDESPDALDRSPGVVDRPPASRRAVPWGRKAPSPAEADRALHGSRRRTRRRRWVAAAAAVMVLVSGVVFWQATGPPGEQATASDELRIVTTQSGQTAELYLSDGTHVTLGVASSLRFPARFDGARDVFLDGEAYFDVAPEERWPWRPDRPFTVRTEGAVARDLGTRFSVRAYPGDANTEVVVAEGAVMLTSEGQDGADLAKSRPVVEDLILAAGDLGRLDADGGVVVARGVDVDAHHAWMRGRLVFTEAPVSEVLARLERWLDLDLRLADPVLSTARVTATFDTGSPPEALRLLAGVLGAEMERNGRRVALRARNGER